MCSAIKLWGKNKEGIGNGQSDGVTSHVIMMCGGTLPSSNKHLPAGGKQRWSDFALFVCMALLYLLNCLYLNSQVFSFLPFLFFPASHSRGQCEWLCVAELPAQSNPQVCFLAPSVGPEVLTIMTDLMGMRYTGFTAAAAVQAMNQQAPALSEGPACFARYQNGVIVHGCHMSQCLSSYFPVPGNILITALTTCLG